MSKTPLIVAAVLIASAAIARAGDPQGPDHHVNTILIPVEGESVTGFVHLTALPQGGTEINLSAKGLVPGETYLSLYYDNDHCELEPYSADDVIGSYVAQPGGLGFTGSKVADDLDEIYSVSVRRASDFTLVACAKVRDEEDESARMTPAAPPAKVAPQTRVAPRR